MYSYVIKGSTLGHLFTRRVLRRITSLPGLVLDAMVAVFWFPQYRDYWKDCGVLYADDTRVGMLEGIFGWIGEFLGYPIGSIIGSALGVGAYIIDSAFWLTRFFVQPIYDTLDKLAIFFGSLQPSFPIADMPADSYLSKGMNLGGYILGAAMGIVPYTAAKLIEFFFPFLGNNLSNVVTFGASFFGSSIGLGIAALLYPAVHVVNKTLELHLVIREKIRYAVAVIYAKTGTIPAVESEDHCLPNIAIHSREFRQEVEFAKKSPWSLLFAHAVGAVKDKEVKKEVVKPKSEETKTVKLYPSLPVDTKDKENIAPKKAM